MAMKHNAQLDPHKRYLQVALNGTLTDAANVIASLPVNDRIIIEAGTPLIKRYGVTAIKSIHDWWSARLTGSPVAPSAKNSMAIGGVAGMLIKAAVAKATKKKQQQRIVTNHIQPYIVADLKMMDRGSAEVGIAAIAGANAATALGMAPIESLNAFIAECEHLGLDSMIDMMNVEYPVAILRALKKQPHVVILHRGVDEERDNKEKALPLYEIRRIKGAQDIMIAVAGGDTVREAQSAVFNDADIVVVWKNFYKNNADTAKLAEQFLQKIQ